ncbi:glycosyltransferase family 4 protein [Gelidibacter pelagius]|uniref:Glycosyltransferase n=1 Tax=Gelidibacter pelagius TaxID=2819985 RepID=A0ABS3SWS5_9FLAO|nr:glycosyltransferase family 4 protein [Gelidibacter pelagius]MBO3100173.1 glycosyltransferase [Gelidibacter pelagius]
MSRKVLFVHDGPMSKFGNNLYSRDDKNKLVSRYLYFGEQVSFLMRSTKLNDKDVGKFIEMTHPAFNFIEIPDFKSLRTLKNKRKVNSIIKQAVAENDIIIIRLPSAAGVIALKEAEKLNKPILIEFVACVYDALWNYDWRGKLLAYPKLYQYQKLMKNVNHTIYVTNNFLQSRYPSNGKSIGCSDVELQDSEVKDSDKNVLSERLEKINSSSNKTLKLVTVGAVDVVYKGQADVIKAIAILKKKGILFKYDIVGAGNPTRLQLIIDELNLNDEIKIVGPLPHDRIFATIVDADIYIQPSKQEGLPRAVVEAMSMACPVIGTNTGGIPELIDKQCVYSKNSIKKLILLLSNVSEDFLIKNSTLNFKNALNYQQKLLNAKRNDFYDVFLNDNNLI